jgi:hypothetical protein
MSYQHLLAELDLRFTRPRNRVVMGSMHMGMEDRFWHYRQLAAYFRERAKGGVGLIIPGGIAPNRQGWLLPFRREPLPSAEDGRRGSGPRLHVIGGARLATALDAKRAIREGAEPASRL